MFTLPELPYDYNALGPSISGDIMRLHHDTHHRTYIEKLNTALESRPEYAANSLETLLSNLEALPDDIRDSVRHNGGGHYNHSLFWQWMTPNGDGEPTGELHRALIERYGSFQAFVDQFTEQALGVFGSGWVWLNPGLDITTTQNQDSPIMTGSGAPILGLDVWEHAYYLDYKNKRDDYVKAWWDVVDWKIAGNRYGS